MKNRKLIFQILIALGIVTTVIILSIFVRPQQLPAATPSTGSGIALQLPALFKTAHAQDAACDVNLLADAGVTAYTNLSEEIDISFLETYFSGPVQQTDQYITGIVLTSSQQKPPQLDEAAVVHAFVCADGWVFAYLSREQPASALIDWTIYEDEGLSTTPLEVVIRLLADDIGTTLSFSDIGYYDFRNPEATSLKLVVDSADTQRPEENFQIIIPKRLVIYEYSWTHAILDDEAGIFIASSNCQHNGTIFSGIQPIGQGTWRFAMGTFSEPETIAGTTENFLVKIYEPSSSYCGVALVY